MFWWALLAYVISFITLIVLAAKLGDWIDAYYQNIDRIRFIESELFDYKRDLRRAQERCSSYEQWFGAQGLDPSNLWNPRTPKTEPAKTAKVRKRK